MSFGLTVILLVLLTSSFADGACMTSLDIAIVLDGSASMGIDGFHSIKQFVIDMISRLDVGPEKVRVCVVRVALDPIMEIELTKFSTALDLENAVSQVIYYQGATEIKDGLNLAAKELLKEESSAKLNSTKFLIVFSDGDFTPFSLNPKINDIKVLAIGSGSTIYKDNLLKTLVKDPSKDFFTTRDDEPADVIRRMGDLTGQGCT